MRELAVLLHVTTTTITTPAPAAATDLAPIVPGAFAAWARRNGQAAPAPDWDPIPDQSPVTQPLRVGSRFGGQYARHHGPSAV